MSLLRPFGLFAIVSILLILTPAFAVDFTTPPAPPPIHSAPVPTGPVTPLSISTSSMPAGVAGTAYTVFLRASGGAAPYSWGISSGVLPPGLSLSAQAGILSGVPTGAGTSTFVVKVTDKASPAHTATRSFSIAMMGHLTITSSSPLAAATSGTAYSAQLTAAGGTPGYSWFVQSGTLPPGLSLASTGIVSGTPTTAGTYIFTVTVKDSGTPLQVQIATETIVVAAASPPPATPGTTWFVRIDGGTRYSGNVPSGQCDGKSDTAYPGSGVNQHCAFNDYRFLWDDRSYGNSGWVIAGGDTVIVDNTAQWRVGFDQAGPNDPWCSGGSGPFACGNPTIPAGTPTQHTRILGRNYAACSASNQPDPSKMTQIYGGHGVGAALNLGSAQYVDVECLEVTRHSSCMVHGLPIYGSYCSSGFPIDDYDSNGVNMDNDTHDVLLQDMYIHGHVNSGIIGPVGGLATLRRVKIAFNGESGWNLDNGSGNFVSTGMVTLSYVSVIANGCIEEYPDVDAFPALVCYDQSASGYGDGIGTPAGFAISFSVDHSVFAYNTQDGIDVGHVDTGSNTLSITDSLGYGNEGQPFKWGANFTTATFVNNVVIADCARMSAPIAGAPVTYNQYLSQWCRAGDTLSFNFRDGGTLLMAYNTIIGASPNMVDVQCWDASCPNATWTFENNVLRGYYDPITANGGGQAPGPGLFYIPTLIGTVNRLNNVFYGYRNGCPANSPINSAAGLLSGESCTDPLFIGEPASFTTESAFDNYNVTPASGSPLTHAGVNVLGITTDYLGNARGVIPSIGAIQ